MSERDMACVILNDLDYDAQLAAIHHVIRGHREADEALAARIEEIDEFARRTSGLRNERALDEWLEHLHASVYQDAAHSMAAVGMLAPLAESLFACAFQGLRNRFQKDTRDFGDHDRWGQPTEDEWDCHYVWNKGKRSLNLVEGIMQLADAVGMSHDLPNDLKPTLEALFAYRNKMFHCGFEWPLAERMRFQQRIKESGWPEQWFSTASQNGNPWIFYLTDEFVQHCLRMFDRVMVGLGTYCFRESQRDSSEGSHGSA